MEDFPRIRSVFEGQLTSEEGVKYGSFDVIRMVQPLIIVAM